MNLKPDEQAAYEAAQSTLERLRRITVRARGRWVQLDDLDPAAEKDLKDRLNATLNEWAAAAGLDMEVQEPAVEVEKGYGMYGMPGAYGE